MVLLSVFSHRRTENPVSSPAASRTRRLQPQHNRANQAHSAKASAVAKARESFLQINAQCKSFDGTAVYDNFGLTLFLGKFTNIFGPNGCGKSTLINMISGLLPMDSGEVLYDGQTNAETLMCSRITGKPFFRGFDQLTTYTIH